MTPSRRREGRRSDWSAPRLVPAVITAAILAIALATRLPRPLATPGWDGDEGYTLDIAWNLAHGDARMYALEYRFVAHPPLAFAALAPALLAFGRDLAVARTVAGTANALAVASVAWGLARAGMPRAATLGGLALAVAPFAVAYGRMAYTYAFLAPVVAATVVATLAWRRAMAAGATYGTRPSAAVPVALAALGPLTDHPGLGLPVLVGLEVRLATRSWLAGAGAAALALAPAAAVHGVIAWLDPAGAAAEWHHLGARLGVGSEGALAAGPSFATTAALVLANVGGLVRAAWWMPVAVAGLFAMPASAGRATILRAFALVAIPALAARPIDPYFRTAVPLLPLAGWGLGAILDRAVRAAFDVAGAVPGRGPIGARLVASGLAALLLLPLGLEAATTAVAVLPPAATANLGPEAGNRSPGAPPFAPTLSLPIDPWLVRDGDDARAAAAFVNARVLPSDLVIASPAVAWLVEARAIDHLQATARAHPGTAVAFYPPAIAPTRWRYDPAVRGARYVVLDRLTDAWVAADAPTRRVLSSLADVVPAFRAGDYRVVAP